MTMLCPCNSNKPFSLCCQPLLAGNKQANTAEELMRSRYTAFNKVDIDYLMKSHHSSTRPLKEKKHIKKWASSVAWLGLQIIRTEAGLEADTNGIVEFKAMFKENGKISSIHEISQFVKENGCWFYVSGKHM